jgi:hypothetical protein
MRVVDFQLYRIDLQTRIPFRYGIATMTRVPEVFVQVNAEFDHGPAVGISSDCLPPKWFTKIPDKPLDAEVAEMLAVIVRALEAAKEITETTPYAFWLALYEQQNSWASKNRTPPLLAHFGTSLVERAVIDAFCRSAKTTFARAVHENSLGINLGAVHEALRGKMPRDFLPAAPLARVIARHTIGLADPLTDGEIPAASLVKDGLPQSLEACVRAYGLRHFKVKVNGDISTDVERLTKIAAVLQTTARDFRFTLDANEQFKSFDSFREYWQIVKRDPDLGQFFQKLLFIEQPLHRDVALQGQAERDLKAWPDRPPIIIDESDGTLDAVPAALKAGYAGASHKNCKGVFKGIVNACFLKRGAGMMSGEDLCNIGPVALLQDLAVMAALGIESVERNGHHYHAGLSQFPRVVQEQVLTEHPDLYQKSAQGWPTLRVTNGSVELNSINSAPFGMGFVLDTTDWKRAM